MNRLARLCMSLSLSLGFWLSLSLVLWLSLSLSAASFALAAEVKGGGKGSFDLRKDIESSSGGACNAGKDKYNGCTCRTDFAKKFTDQLSKNSAGEPSGGQCLYGVRSAFQEACNQGKEGSGWCQNAKDSTKCLSDLKFVSQAGKPIPEPPPEGAVFVFNKGSGHPGHIEVFTKSGYCSDFCSKNRINTKNNAYQLVEWYLPPTQQQCDSGNFTATSL